MTGFIQQASDQEQATTEQLRTLSAAAIGTVLALVAYTTPIATLADTARDLNSGPGGQTWILSSMNLGLAVGLLPAGAIGDRYGRRRVFGVGAHALAATSVVAALSAGTTTLVLARIGAGLATAAMLSCSLALISHVFPAGRQRVHATGVWGASLGAGIATGPLLAGALDGGPGWRSAYWLIAALATVLGLLSRRLLPETGKNRAEPMDLVGMSLLAAALTSVLAGLVEGRLGWGRPLVAGMVSAGAVLGVAFVKVELTRRAPILDLRLFRRPDFATATIAALATGAGIIAIMSFLPTLVQRGLGLNAFSAALILLPWSATSVLTALLARRLPPRFPPRAQLGVGLLGVAVGQVMLTGVTPGSGGQRLLSGLLVAGAASGMLNAALARQAVASVPVGQAGIGSGTNNTARYLGAAIGVTVVSVLAAQPNPADVIAGWNIATLVTAAVAAAGGLVVLAYHSRTRSVLAEHLWRVQNSPGPSGRAASNRARSKGESLRTFSGHR